MRQPISLGFLEGLWTSANVEGAESCPFRSGVMRELTVCSTDKETLTADELEAVLENMDDDLSRFRLAVKRALLKTEVEIDDELIVETGGMCVGCDHPVLGCTC